MTDSFVFIVGFRDYYMYIIFVLLNIFIAVIMILCSPINEEKLVVVVPTLQQNKSDTNITVEGNGDTRV